MKELLVIIIGQFQNVNYQFSGNKFSANDELLLRLNGNNANWIYFVRQAGLFKIEEYDDSNVLNKKMITIKNLKYTGTAPQWLGCFQHYYGMDR